MSKLLTEFKSELKTKRQFGDEIVEMYHHLFSLLSDEDLTSILEGWFEHFKSDHGWYFQFHKSIRQTDFFNNIRAYSIIDKLTPEQNKRRSELLSLRIEMRKKHGEKNEMDDDTFSEYKKLGDELFELNSLQQTKEPLEINGHLDMLLWNTIHLDSKDVLKDIFERTFKLCS